MIIKNGFEKIGLLRNGLDWIEMDKKRLNMIGLNKKQAQLRLCKLEPGTVLIFYKFLAPTPIYI